MERTADLVEQWWAELFGVRRDRLWRDPTVRHHSMLGDYEGWYVAWRHGVAHVSAPPGSDLDDVPVGLTDAMAWEEYAGGRGLRVIGPSYHAYLDRSPGAVDGVAPAAPGELARLRVAVTAQEWSESGFESLDPSADPAFALVEDGEVAAAANLTEFAGAPRDVGLLVHPHARCRGLGRLLGRHAAAYAVERSGLARWRALTTNGASLAIAGGLGFERYCTQLAVRA